MNAAALFYPWLKALHVAAATVFVGGVLAAAVVLRARPGEITSAPAQSTIENLRAWHRGITTPAMVLVWALGIVLALQAGWFTAAWLQLKLALVVVLSAVHGVQSGVLRRLEDEGPAEHLGVLRFSGALTVVLVAVLAVLVIVKPL